MRFFKAYTYLLDLSMNRRKSENSKVRELTQNKISTYASTNESCPDRPLRLQEVISFDNLKIQDEVIFLVSHRGK